MRRNTASKPIAPYGLREIAGYALLQGVQIQTNIRQLYSVRGLLIFDDVFGLSDEDAGALERCNTCNN